MTVGYIVVWFWFCWQFFFLDVQTVLKEAWPRPHVLWHLSAIVSRCSGLLVAYNLGTNKAALIFVSDLSRQTRSVPPRVFQEHNHRSAGRTTLFFEVRLCSKLSMSSTDPSTLELRAPCSQAAQTIRWSKSIAAKPPRELKSHKGHVGRHQESDSSPFLSRSRSQLAGYVEIDFFRECLALTSTG